jgi:hypothetical protein
MEAKFGGLESLRMLTRMKRIAARAHRVWCLA